MAWSEGQSQNGWAVYTETIALDTSATDQSSSAISFIPYGKDFRIEADPSGTLATTAPVDIDICDSESGTYFEMCTTGVSLVTGGTASRDLIDNSAKGQAPFYKLRIDKPAALKAATGSSVVLKVLVPPKNGVIY